MPRTAQHGSAAINLYAPRYAPPGPPLDAFAYLPFTHAYFPTERFDEVRQVDGWTLGRRGDGYVALWSWRPTEWRSHDPAVTFTNGLTQPFDLVAPGGADNVWVTEVGDAGAVGVVRRLRRGRRPRSAVDVTDLGDTAEGTSRGFEVTYASPSQGEMAFSWTGPLTVDGTEVALHGTGPHRQPVHAGRGGRDPHHRRRRRRPPRPRPAHRSPGHPGAGPLTPSPAQGRRRRSDVSRAGRARTQEGR